MGSQSTAGACNSPAGAISHAGRCPLASASACEDELDPPVQPPGPQRAAGAETILLCSSDIPGEHSCSGHTSQLGSCRRLAGTPRAGRDPTGITAAPAWWVTHRGG